MGGGGIVLKGWGEGGDRCSPLFLGMRLVMETK